MAVNRVFLTEEELEELVEQEGTGDYGIYLLHFREPLAHAHHYLGMVHDPEAIEDRVEMHRKGRGARLTQVVSQKGIEMIIARTWLYVPRSLERRLKNRGGAARICPICRGEKII